MPAYTYLSNEHNFRYKSFLSFIIADFSNLFYIFGTLVISISLWIIFKTYYPNANLIFDSYHYLIATTSNTNAYAWPVGYAKFIRFVGIFTHNIDVLIFLQYFIFQLALLLFLLSLRFLLGLGNLMSIIFFLFFSFNPIFLYSSNLILSDILFTSLSVIWLTQLLWIIYQPGYYLLFTQAIILLFAFTVRYNALYFPFVATAAFILSKLPVKWKILGIGLQFVVIGAFVLFTSSQMKANYGVWQFSPFGGWKLSNDALYMYEHVDKKTDVPAVFKSLDDTVRNYFKAPHDTVHVLKYDVTWGSYYMYIYPSPLMKYMRSIHGEDYSPLNFKTFSLMGPLYQDYGSFLIKHYPVHFCKYFILPNLQRYLIPPGEVYADDVNPFYLRNDDLDAPARNWFHITSTSSTKDLISVRHQILDVYPVLNAILQLVFILVLLGNLFIMGSQLKNSHLYHAIILIAFLWICDIGFSLLAAAVVLRYQLFMMIALFAFTLLLIDNIVRATLSGSSDN